VIADYLAVLPHASATLTVGLAWQSWVRVEERPSESGSRKPTARTQHARGQFAGRFGFAQGLGWGRGRARTAPVEIPPSTRRVWPVI
jgi:hypothetical protein